MTKVVFDAEDIVNNLTDNIYSMEYFNKPGNTVDCKELVVKLIPLITQSELEPITKMALSWLGGTKILKADQYDEAVFKEAISITVEEMLSVYEENGIRTGDFVGGDVVNKGKTWTLSITPSVN